MTRERQRQTLRMAELRDQYQWIQDHGGNEAGYVLNYGDAPVDARDIYAADRERLLMLMEAV